MIKHLFHAPESFQLQAQLDLREQMILSRISFISVSEHLHLLSSLDGLTPRSLHGWLLLVTHVSAEMSPLQRDHRDHQQKCCVLTPVTFCFITLPISLLSSQNFMKISCLFTYLFSFIWSDFPYTM